MWCYDIANIIGNPDNRNAKLKLKWQQHQATNVKLHASCVRDGRAAWGKQGKWMAQGSDDGRILIPPVRGQPYR